MVDTIGAVQTGLGGDQTIVQDQAFDGMVREYWGPEVCQGGYLELAELRRQGSPC